MSNAPEKPVDEGDEMPTGFLLQMAKRQPALAAIVMLLGGAGGATFLGPLIMPYVDGALSVHEADDRAHDIDRLEDRLKAMEGSLEESRDKAEETREAVNKAVTLLEAKAK